MVMGLPCVCYRYSIPTGFFSFAAASYLPLRARRCAFAVARTARHEFESAFKFAHLLIGMLNQKSHPQN
jgi:hypothetical protein